ncbi:hypothetical protein Y032_0692g1581 [Ancylostoma ceylanicum]|uniref:Uncharacterized protein n=1 Tax=Ancylostoma ceylanicum TaxID=53326 RepID=A0A016WGT5_9BILA|nr:hypothetical protein Y032_0692g1581 [Ancylostoma ceylanicum]
MEILASETPPYYETSRDVELTSKDKTTRNEQEIHENGTLFSVLLLCPVMLRCADEIACVDFIREAAKLVKYPLASKNLWTIKAALSTFLIYSILLQSFRNDGSDEAVVSLFISFIPNSQVDPHRSRVASRFPVSLIGPVVSEGL